MKIIGGIIIAVIVYKVISALWGFIVRHKALAAVLLLLGFAFMQNQDLLSELLVVIYLVCIWAGAFWIYNRLFGRRKGHGRRKSFRSTVISSANETVSQAIEDLLIPKKPTPQEIERERQRAQAKKDYAFHTRQAEKYSGTRDGEYHKAEARRAYDRMK